MKNKLLRVTACTALAVAAIGLSMPAEAQRGGGGHGGGGGGHGGGGFHGGGGYRGGYGYGRGGGLGWWGPGLGLGLGWGAAYPYYYDYPYDASPYLDDGYVDNVPLPAAGAAPAPSPNWYYCEPSRDYYPHVTQCSQAWRIVPATPAAPAQ